MKKVTKQEFKVTLEDGTKVIVCCGPAIVRLGGAVVAYEPIGEAKEATYCCHAGPIRETAERQTQELHKKLEEMQLYPIRNFRRKV